MSTQTVPPLAGTAPSPDGGWASEFVTLKSAMLVPPAVSGRIQPCGVLDSDGKFCAHSATWRGPHAMITPPDAPEKPTAKLSGRHLYAGQFWVHFGHFLLESLSRLWVLDQLDALPDSILYIPKRPARKISVMSYQRDIYNLLGINMPIQLVEEPTEVEELIVPGQGFGMGKIAHGTKEFRGYIKNNFARDIAPVESDGLYLSRSALTGLEGGVVLEKQLEENLALDGYEIYHPQTHSVSEQVAKYKGAKRIIGPDGSAFHLFGFVGQPDQKVGVILRRNSGVFQSQYNQISTFAGIEPAIYEAVVADWIPDHKPGPGRYSYGQLDFEETARQMQQSGLISQADKWDIPSFRAQKQFMAALSKKKQREYWRKKIKNDPTQAAAP